MLVTEVTDSTGVALEVELELELELELSPEAVVVMVIVRVFVQLLEELEELVEGVVEVEDAVGLTSTEVHFVTSATRPTIVTGILFKVLVSVITVERDAPVPVTIQVMF